MTSVGKLLVVLQLILSISFVVFAGAVYSTHKTWRAKAEQAEQQATKARNDMNAAVAELNAKTAEADAAVAAATNEVQQLRGQLKNANDALAAAQQTNNDLNAQVLAQTGLAEAKAAEMKYRLEQALVQSSVNNVLHEKLEATAAKARKLGDELFGSNLKFEQLEERYNDTVNELADMKTVLVATGVPTDLDTIRSQGEPPPPIDGVVIDTKRNKTGNVYMIEISVGSDDGLAKGHELSVVRPAERNEGRAKFLGTIEIIRLSNDTAVGRVIDRTKSGIIEEGDNVTGKL